MSKVTVKLTQAGEVITQNANKPEFGYFLVVGQQGKFIGSDTGFGNYQRARQCLVAMRWSDLEVASTTGMVVDDKGTVVVLAEGTELPGKIIIRESTNQADLYPNAADANVGMKFRSGAHRKAGLCYANGDQPIYQKKSFVTNLEAQDVLIPATNTADVNAFTAEQLAKGNEFLLADFKPKAGAIKKPVGAK